MAVSSRQLQSPASSNPDFDRLLARHRDLHDLTKPLVDADYSHALDVWQWMLRLEPKASLAAQIAALFHDVERLTSEAEARIEHRAADYQAFKDEHARRGAEITDAVLADLGFDEGTRFSVYRLISAHERPPGPSDPDSAELALLNDADSLSFFSLNSPGYLDYFGPEATRRKITFTLGRLSPAARRRLAEISLRPDVAKIAAPLFVEEVRV